MLACSPQGPKWVNSSESRPGQLPAASSSLPGLLHPLSGTQDPDTPQPSAHNLSELGPGSPHTLRGLRLQEENGQAHALGTQRLPVNIL